MTPSTIRVSSRLKVVKLTLGSNRDSKIYWFLMYPIENNCFGGDKVLWPAQAFRSDAQMLSELIAGQRSLYMARSSDGLTRFDGPAAKKKAHQHGNGSYSLRMKPWIPLASEYHPATSPLESIPTGYVLVDPGTSKTVISPSSSRIKPWYAFAASR